MWVDTRVHPGTVVLTVENSGEVLSPQLVSTLTEPFQRGTERLRNDHAGVGLGLAIVKSIAHVHDGFLTIVPRPGGGLRITVELPAPPPDDGIGQKDRAVHRSPRVDPPLRRAPAAVRHESPP